MNRMSFTVCSALVALCIGAHPALAQSRIDPLETVDQARARHSAENYQWQQRHGTPLGGYQDRLGDPAPRGTILPGYANPNSYGYQPPNTGNGNYWDQQTAPRQRRY